MLKVIDIYEMMNIGSTRPLLVICSDSKRYILKGINDYTSTGKVLFNEVVGNRFANLINLETPRMAIGELSQTVIANSPIPNLKDCNFRGGKCFLSEYKEGTSLPIFPPTLKYISNIEIVPKLILFDAILMNSDRDSNSGNWFRLKHENKLIAIDHSNIFRLAQIWDETSLKHDMQHPPLIIDEIKNGQDYHLLLHEYQKRRQQKNQHANLHNHPFSAVERSIKKLSSRDLEQCFVGIPPEWGVTAEEIGIAKDFLCFQISHVSDIILELEKYLIRDGR